MGSLALTLTLTLTRTRTRTLSSYAPNHAMLPGTSRARVLRLPVIRVRARARVRVGLRVS